MPKLSYWEKESFFKHIDVAIIGSGIVGLSAAIHLKEYAPNLRVVIFERGTLPIGASTRNAGFACFGSMTELLDDLNNLGEDEVFTLVEKRWKGLLKLRSRVGDSQLKYQALGGFELFRREDTEDFQECSEQIDYFNTRLKEIIGHREVFKIKDEKIQVFGFQHIQHLIHNQAEGQIHTGEMMKALLEIAKAKDVQILNGIAIKKINDQASEVILETSQGWKIESKKVLIATNGFSKLLLPTQAIQPARNQVIITKPIQKNSIRGCFHYDQGYFYFRNIDGRILLGGGRNLAKQDEATAEFGSTDIIQSALRDLLKNVILPNQAFEIESTWSGILSVGNTKHPIVKNISENVVAAVRLGGMGVAIGSLAGEEGAKLMVKKL
ncbi:MAG: FAD-dependent oxidoreductase [Bacteroidota bacterium]